MHSLVMYPKPVRGPLRDHDCCPSPDLKKPHSYVGSSQIQSSFSIRIKCWTRLQQFSGQTKLSYKLPFQKTLALCWTTGISSNQTGANRQAFYTLESISAYKHYSLQYRDKQWLTWQNACEGPPFFSAFSFPPQTTLKISNTMWCNWQQTLQKQNMKTLSPQQNLHKCDLQHNQNTIKLPHFHLCKEI